MPKQILMPEVEFEEELASARRQGEAWFKREFLHEMWPIVFPGEEYHRGKSLDETWPKFVNAVVTKFS